MDDSMVSQGDFSTQNGNGHKCSWLIDRADKAIHGSNTAIANSMWHHHIGWTSLLS